MKTKHFLYAMMFTLGPTFAFVDSASAQEEIAVYEEMTITEVIPVKPRYYAERFGNNMYLSIGAGAQTLLAEHDNKARYTLAMNLALGKWLTPSVGLRLSAMAGSLHSDWIYAPNNMNHIRYAAVYGDVTFDLCNAIGGYNEKRVVSVIPFAGIGFSYGFKNSNTDNNKTYAFPVSAGLKLNFRLSHYVDFFLEGRANLLTDQFNGIVKSAQVESVVSAIGGFSVKFGKDRFKQFDPYADKAIISDLNNRVNMLRADLDAANARKCPPCPEVKPRPEVKEVVTCDQDLTSVVRFTINKSTVTNEEMVNIYNIAEWMKKNPKCNVKVVGYADKGTGTPKYNLELSKKRADAVAKILVEKYGIDKNRVMMTGDGSESQPYPDNNNWNRVVIFMGAK